MEDEGEEEGGERVALLSARGAGNPCVAEEKMRGDGVAGFCPGGSFRTMLSDRIEHRGATYAIESIFKVQE